MRLFEPGANRADEAEAKVCYGDLNGPERLFAALEGAFKAVNMRAFITLHSLPFSLCVCVCLKGITGKGDFYESSK